MYRVSSAVPRFARALLAGAVLATVWVNLDPSSYYDFIEWRLLDADLPDWLSPHPLSFTLRAFVVDVLMAFFLFFLGKELWEALRLERGAMTGRQAILPVALALGGMIGAALVWILAATRIETAEEAMPGMGWQVGLGSDVVLCFLIGARLFGTGHPALQLLLLVTLLTDFLALLVLGITAPLPDLRPAWLLLPLAAAVLVWLRYGRAPAEDAPERDRRARLGLWPYLLAGAVSWLGVAASGLPPALGFLPILPAIAHADRSFGLFAEAEEILHDPLNRLARHLARPLTAVLFGFGLLEGGVELAAFAPTTVVTLASLWLGRPLGMLILGIGLAALLGLRLPAGLVLRDVLIVIALASSGFTVPILALDLTLPGGAMQEGARMGLAISLLAGPALLLLLRRKTRVPTAGA